MGGIIKKINDNYLFHAVTNLRNTGIFEPKNSLQSFSDHFLPLLNWTRINKSRLHGKDFKMLAQRRSKMAELYAFLLSAMVVNSKQNANSKTLIPFLNIDEIGRIMKEEIKLYNKTDAENWLKNDYIDYYNSKYVPLQEITIDEQHITKEDILSNKITIGEIEKLFYGLEGSPQKIDWEDCADLYALYQGTKELDDNEDDFLSAIKMDELNLYHFKHETIDYLKTDRQGIIFANGLMKFEDKTKTKILDSCIGCRLSQKGYRCLPFENNIIFDLKQVDETHSKPSLTISNGYCFKDKTYKTLDELKEGICKTSKQQSELSEKQTKCILSLANASNIPIENIVLNNGLKFNKNVKFDIPKRTDTREY